jgi:sigma-B regulation protein RsbU (phosphoserine phosphatase)
VGLTKTSRYLSHQLGPLAAGQVILLGTDGIWETRNPEGKMFGKKAVRKIIRQHHASDAGVIQGAILDKLSGFRQHRPPEDDVTLVVVKIRQTGTTASKKYNPR